MKEKAFKREKRRKLGNSSWTPKLNDKVLVKSQPMSDAIKGMKSKFMLLYDGPFFISKLYPHSAYELMDENRKARGKFSIKALKPYKEENQHLFAN
jgi:hypothetical protein